MRLTNAAIPAALQERPGDDLALFDISLDGDRIASVEPASGSVIGARDCAGGIVVPGFVDMHTHLDKAYIWPRAANEDGTFDGAIASARADRTANWSADDLTRRMDFALRTAYAHGTVAIRTHLDCEPPQDGITWPVFAALRQAWAGRIALQGVALVDVPALADLSRLIDTLADYGGLVGGFLYPHADSRANTRAILEAAEARGLDVDFHVDEGLDPARNDLTMIAEEALRIGFSGTISCGHCCTLMAMEEADANRTLDKVAESGLHVVSLPLCNAYLMDRRHGRTPRIRGGTLVHEMSARAIPVSFASDNVRDPFYAYGDFDMLEVWREATRSLHLDTPVGAWPLAVNAQPAATMGLADRDRLAPGAPADLVLFDARGWGELFSQPQMGRTLIRNGTVVDTAPPDTRELDELWTSPR